MEVAPLRLFIVIAQWVTLLGLALPLPFAVYAEANSAPSSPTLVQSQAAPVYRIGVLANWGYLKAEQRWQPMMAYLSQQIPDAQFQVQAGNFTELNQALFDNQIQFIITNPGQYQFLAKQYPLSWLATMRSRQHNGTSKAIGSAIVVRADSPYYSLYDLKGKTVAASDPHALGGYQATVGLMNRLGMAIEHWFADIHFLGFPLDPLLYQVRDRHVDAAITPVCTLEQMSQAGLINSAHFRVLNPIQPPDFDCQSSTSLYPNWSFAASESITPPLAKAITQALLALPADHPAALQADLLGWTSPISQLQVFQLFSELNHSQRPQIGNAEILQWLKTHQHWGGVALFLFVLATVYHFWLEYKFRQKSDVLIETERQLKRKAIAMEKLQSSAILGEIGAGLAHEINQPIAAITSYSEGGIMRFEAKPPTTEECLALLEKINRQSVRAGEVVHRIRGLLRRRETVMEDVNLLSLVEETQALLKVECERHGVHVSTRVQGEPFFVTADRVGMLQVLVNVLKNSLDAIAEQTRLGQLQNQGQILIEFHFMEHQVNLSVSDNGGGLSLPAEDLKATFFSTKENGLGLGLAICTDMLKQHDGHFDLQNRRDGVKGCITTLKLKRRGRSEALI